MELLLLAAAQGNQSDITAAPGDVTTSQANGLHLLPTPEGNISDREQGGLLIIITYCVNVPFLMKKHH